MKKTINLSILYAILAMSGGVFFREFTKFNHFDGVTFIHTTSYQECYSFYS